MNTIIFDLETTGLLKHPHAKLATQPKAIEFGAVLLDEGCAVVDKLQLLINPGQPLEAIITKITGLTDEDLFEEPSFAEVWPQIRALFSRADVMISHNLPFDSGVLGWELHRWGIEGFAWPRHKICTVQENVPAWGRRPKLTELYAAETGQPLAQTHRAIDDVMALVEVIRKQGVIHAIHSAAQGTL